CPCGRSATDAPAESRASGRAGPASAPLEVGSRRGPSRRTGPRTRFSSGRGEVQSGAMPMKPTTVVLFGATGDLSRRKLLPGLLHLFQTGLMRDIRVVGTSLD